MGTRASNTQESFARVDLLEGSDEDFSQYFDKSEFVVREQLETDHYWHVYRRDVILDLVRTALPQSARSIELGCGTGNVATWLNRNGYHVDYGDVHREGLEAAERRARRWLTPSANDPLTFFRLDITKQFPRGSYEGVFLFDVLEHLPNPEQVLATVREKIRPKGAVVFTVPAFSFLWSPWDDFQKHKRRYTAESARALAEENGFRLERLTYFFSPLFFAAGGVKLLRKLREKTFGAPETGTFDELVEAKTHPALNAAMLGTLGLERSWLRSHDLPLGTSLICVARPK